MKHLLQAKTPPHISAHLKTTAIDYLIGRAHIELITPIVKAYSADAWQEANETRVIYPDPSWGEFVDMTKPLEPDALEFATEEEARRYYDVLEQHKQRAGFTDCPPDYCPLLIAEMANVKQRRAMIEASAYIHGMSSHKIMMIDKSQELADLVIGLVISQTDIKIDIKRIKATTSRAGFYRAVAYTKYTDPPQEKPDGREIAR